jgi:hypothetical protein
MSIRISLDNPPEFYTNLDFLHGRIILSLRRAELIGNVIVKLEGESRTAIPIQQETPNNFGRPSDMVTESHKILYKLFPVFPENAVPVLYQPGQHEFKFRFKLPLNNICHDARAISSTMGIAGIGGAGFRTSDGSKQLMLAHLKATLPPSLTGFPQEAEIRYYVKVTIQRPGIFKENWRYQLGFKFLPIEPPRPDATTQEAFARRPFAFKPRTPLQQSRWSFFASKPSADTRDGINQTPPSVEMSARLPYPSILTCNEPIPLRILAKKLVPAREQVYLTSLEVALIGYTNRRVATLEKVERTTWIVVSAVNLKIPLGSPSDPVGTELEIPNTLWANQVLPNTVAPSFRTCNLARRYALELRFSLSWGLQSSGWLPQVVALPLVMSQVQVYSGIKPPPQLIHGASFPTNPMRPPNNATAASVNANSNINTNGNMPAPHPPPRPSGNGNPPIPPRPADPLYPPQLGPDNVPPHDDAPPSYDEAMAESLTGPQERPAYSGVTAENAPSTMPPEKPMS